jgi:hypothetical protein
LSVVWADELESIAPSGDANALSRLFFRINAVESETRRHSGDCGVRVEGGANKVENMAKNKSLRKKSPAGDTQAKADAPSRAIGIRSLSGPLTGRESARWTFLTNHSHVLILLSRNPSIVLREVAALVGITERAVQRIIADLEDECVIEREKVGRQNRYRVLANKSLRHPIESHRKVADLLRAIDGTN